MKHRATTLGPMGPPVLVLYCALLVLAPATCTATAAEEQPLSQQGSTVNNAGVTAHATHIDSTPQQTTSKMNTVNCSSVSTHVLPSIFCCAGDDAVGRHMQKDRD